MLTPSIWRCVTDATIHASSSRTRNGSRLPRRLLWSAVLTSALAGPALVKYRMNESEQWTGNSAALPAQNVPSPAVSGVDLFTDTDDSVWDQIRKQVESSDEPNGT